MFLTNAELEDERRRWTAKLVSTCKVCNGKGWVTTGDLDITKSSVCRCVRMVERNVRLVNSGMPRKFLDNQWSTATLKDKAYGATVLKYIDTFATNGYPNGRGLLLTGAHGRGKTTVACIVGKRVATQTHPWRQPAGAFTVGFALYDDMVRWQFTDAKKPLLEQLLRRDLLIIDNVGDETGRGSEKRTAERLLEMIIRKRDNASLPLIISTNYTEEELGKAYSADVRDFLLQNCDVVFVSGDNHRAEAGQQGEFDF